MPDPDTIEARESPGGPPPGLGAFAKRRWSKSHPPSDPAVSFAGKVVLVTGANTGLGYQAALKYASLGAGRLILAVRTAEKGEDARRRIVEQTGYDGDRIVVLAVDLGDFASVRAFCDALGDLTPTLDVALLNAGLGQPTYQTSAAGWEMAVQVNVLSTALMAVLLLPLLRAAAAAEDRPPAGTTTPPHLTFVNSNGHDMVRREWLGEDQSLLRAANDKDGWDDTRSYATVKLLGMAVMQAMARNTLVVEGLTDPKQKPRPQVIVNAVCPALCRTDLGRSYSWLARKVGMPIFYGLFARTAEEGSRSLVSATALGPESHGRFWHHDILYP
jgi:NAD(P)-dependent dehydrogenase (short-subunit alcohol dehydrogenase family)